MGRYEESIEAGTTAIETARKLDRRDSVMLNYSTLPLRETFALDEARERSETAIERFGGPSDFNMPWMNARADLIGAQLLLGDFHRSSAREATWEDALASEAWERWLVSGRLAANRAELELGLGRFDDAVTCGACARGSRDPRAPAEVRGERVDHARAGAARAETSTARRPSSARPSRCRTSWGRRSRVGRLAPRSWRWSGRRREATPRGTPVR